jgi:hypothetical protein
MKVPYLQRKKEYDLFGRKKENFKKREREREIRRERGNKKTYK